MRGRWPGIGIVAAALVLAPAASAPGAGGDLASLGCVEDLNPSGVLEECTHQFPGLDGASGVAVSHDGRSVLVASPGDDAIVGLMRNVYTGKLEAQGCEHDDDTGADLCGQSTDGLDGVMAVASSPDDRFVYAVSRGDGAIVSFDDGGLLPLGCVDDDDPPDGPDDCAQSYAGLDGASSLAISPDGASLYAAGTGDDALVAFSRDTTRSGHPAGHRRSTSSSSRASTSSASARPTSRGTST